MQIAFLVVLAILGFLTGTIITALFIISAKLSTLISLAKIIYRTAGKDDFKEW